MNQVIQERINQLDRIVSEYPTHIPVNVAASYCGTNPDSLRQAIRGGTCPFGYMWNQGARDSFCIPTPKFYLWITGGTV